MGTNMLKEITAFLAENNNPLGLLILGASALIEYLFPPFPGDTVVLFGAFLAMRYGWSIILVFLSTLAGSIVGAMIDLWIGRWLSRRYREGKWLSDSRYRQRLAKILTAFERHGPAYIAINRFLPGIRAFIFVAAGMAELPFKKVLFYTLISSLLWNGLILSVAYTVGANWDRLFALFQQYGLVVWSMIGIVAVTVLVRWIIKKHV